MTLLAILLILIALDLASGRIWLSAADFWQLIRLGPKAEMWILVWELRLPRVLTAIAAGAAFGLAGAICQSLFRNPLAAPEMLGVTAGATLGAVALVLLGFQGAVLSFGAVVGAALATVLLLLLSGPAPAITRLILTGVGLSLTAGALTGLLLARAEDRLAGDAILWMTGSLNGRHWPQAGAIWSASIPLFTLAALGARVLDRLELGDDLAQSLGIAVRRRRMSLLILAAALIAAAVAVTGPIGWVGLMAGPIARRLSASSGPDLAGAGMVGALILLLADLLVVWTAPLALIPAGVVTGLLGAPWLIWLLWRGNVERTPA
jgi:iron complex transport system permease protein